MSTRIFNTFVWNKDLDSLIKYFNNIKSSYVNIIVHGYIPRNVKAGYLNNFTDRQLIDKIREETSSPEKGNLLDFLAEFMVYQFNNKIVFQFFGNEQILKLFNIKLPSFDFYDGGDIDEDFEKVYEERSTWWNGLFEHYNKYEFSSLGLCYSIWNDYMIFDIIEELYLLKINTLRNKYPEIIDNKKEGILNV